MSMQKLPEEDFDNQGEPEMRSEAEKRHVFKTMMFSGIVGMVFFAVVGLPLGAPVFTGFMRKLGASELVYSVVLAIPVLGAIAQLFGAFLIERTGRRKPIMVFSGMLNRTPWVLIGLVPLVFKGDMADLRIPAVCALIVLSSTSGYVTTCAYQAWMADVIPSGEAGNFFGVRTMVSTASSLISSIIISVCMDRITDFNGFAAILIIAAVFGSLDILSYLFLRDDQMKPRAGSEGFRFRAFSEAFKNKNYVIFTFAMTFWSFGSNISAPFYNIYMLETLHMKYLDIMLSTQVVQNIATIFFVRLWGLLIDRFGNRAVMRVCLMITVFSPLVWFFATPSNHLSIYIGSVFAGISVSGINLGMFNQTLWLAPRKNRAMYVSFYTLFVAVLGTAAAYVIGGLFMEYSRDFISGLPVTLVSGMRLNNLHALVMISMLLRFIAVVFIYPRVKEERSASVSEMVREISRQVRECFAGLRFK